MIQGGLLHVPRIEFASGKGFSRDTLLEEEVMPQ
jgi:hypothetical protein